MSHGGASFVAGSSAMGAGGSAPCGPDLIPGMEGISQCTQLESLDDAEGSAQDLEFMEAARQIEQRSFQAPPRPALSKWDPVQGKYVSVAPSDRVQPGALDTGCPSLEPPRVVGAEQSAWSRPGGRTRQPDGSPAPKTRQAVGSDASEFFPHGAGQPPPPPAADVFSDAINKSMATVQTLLQGELQALGSQLHASIASIQESNDRRFNQHHGDSEALSRRVLALETSAQRSEQSLGRVEARLELGALVQEQTHRAVDAVAWDREPRGDVLTVGSRTPVARDRVLALVHDLGRRIDVPPEHLVVSTGSAVGTQFVISLVDSEVTMATQQAHHETPWNPSQRQRRTMGRGTCGYGRRTCSSLCRA